VLNYSASAINAVTSAFNFLGYSFVLLGGWLSDRSLGRRKTILVFGTIYLFSLVLLAVSASPVVSYHLFEDDIELTALL
jgi:dipeptide/tripeptide permease